MIYEVWFMGLSNKEEIIGMIKTRLENIKWIISLQSKSAPSLVINLLPVWHNEKWPY